jgi:hypothetical protein
MIGKEADRECGFGEPYRVLRHSCYFFLIAVPLRNKLETLWVYRESKQCGYKRDSPLYVKKRCV